MKEFCVNGKTDEKLLTGFDVRAVFEMPALNGHNAADSEKTVYNDKIIKALLKDLSKTAESDKGMKYVTDGISVRKLNAVNPDKLTALYGFEYEGKHKTVELRMHKIRYSALVAQEPTEVFRENRDHELGLLTHDAEIQSDIDFSRGKIAENNLYFRDTKGAIAINIHSGTAQSTSSQGCQNVPSTLYASFYKEAASRGKKLRERNPEILYTVIDASKIEE